MLWAVLIYIFIFILVFHFIFYHQYHLPKYVREINKIPGPSGVFYFGNILQFYHLKPEEILPHFHKEFKTWGSTLRFWFSGIGIVAVSEVEDVQTVLSSKLDQNKGIMYDYLKPWLGTGLITSNGEKWKRMRKIITPSFHFSILQGYISTFSKNSKIMMDILNEHASKEICSLNNYITYCSLDNIYETSMGKCINSQITRSENEYVKAIFRVGQIVTERVFSPIFLADHIFMLSPLGRENSKLLKILHGVTSNLIRERKERFLTDSPGNVEDDENDRKKVPFLDLLIEKQKSFYFSDKDLREEVDTVLMAGHDTTAAGLSWCLFELGYNEDIQDRVFEELQEIFESSDREPTYQDLMRMDYLKRVLQETLRLYPSAPVISRKFDADIRLKNYVVPAQTEIVLILYLIHRNPNIFPNPEVFDPDRFLPEVTIKRNPFAYIPFGGGSRRCLGEKYSMLQMLVIASSILRKYKVKTLNAKESIKPIPDVILRPNMELQWKLTPRT